MNLEHAKKLDELLKLLLEVSISNSKIEDSSYKYIKEQDAASKLNISERRLQQHLMGLKDDKFIDFVFFKGENNLDYCFITELGVIFIEDGGFTQKQIDKEAQETRLKAIEDRQIELSELSLKRSSQMVNLTWILAIGTSIAALFYGIEILKYLIKFFLKLL